MTAGRDLERTFRDEWAGVLATLARQVRDVQLAEDAVQDAFVDAATAWSRDGTPRDPRAWLLVAARRRAIDRLRRERGLADRVVRVGLLEELDRPAPARTDAIADDPMDDDRLRLLFACAHPSLALEAQIALTLRTLGGLTTAEIAHAFLVPEATMAQRLVRAKRKIAAATIPIALPREADLPDRLDGVLHVIYLVFTEGLDPSVGADAARVDLSAEALRLARLVAALMPDEPEALGLFALTLLHDARRDARIDAGGALVTLDLQDRSRWDAAAIAEGTQHVRRALRHRPPRRFALEAAIVAVHCEATAFAQTDWREIAGLYAALGATAPSPIVEVNRAVAVAYADGPDAGLAVLVPLLGEPALRDYRPLHVAHGELLARAAHPEAARAAFDRALALAANGAQRDEVVRRRAKLPSNDAR